MDISQVYNNIADDFSKTRYKAWPCVKAFIDNIKLNTINADIGCGNGKNMLCRPELSFQGMDISTEFVKICRSRNLDVIHGNILNIPYEDNKYDNTICIAVVHHLENRLDRVKAMQELLRITKINGDLMIYVWAFEQPEESARKFTTQDEMVYFKKRSGEVYYRYYHLYKEGELEEEINDTGVNLEIKQSGYERGNWFCIISKK